MIEIKEPFSESDFEKYYETRWKILREPWKKPRGSEKDEMEEISIHAMATNKKEEVLGVIRLHQINELEGQLRYMGVNQECRSLGVGSKLLSFIEEKAKEKKIKEIILHSRESAVSFYLKNGYVLESKSYLMWNEIQHFLMRKTI